MIETLWFVLLAAMLAVYVILDGFDLGAGMVHLFAARTDAERRQVLASIGPVWDGNEVWLLAAGGTLYFAFPDLYASSFSGFYLPLMMVLWLLILRGIAIEFRNHIESPVWTPLWDVVFAGASTLLAVFFGAALGNVIRGVPLDDRREFFLPLWTDFTPGGEVGILDWYTVPVGLLTAAALLLHGALWVQLKTTGPVHDRAAAIANPAAAIAAVLTAAVTVLTFAVQPQLAANLAAHPWGALLPLIAVGGLIGVALLRADERGRFLSSCFYLGGMLSSAAFGLFPNVLPGVGGAASLTVYNAAAPAHGLRIGLFWWIPGVLIAIAYAFFLYGKFSGKVLDPKPDQ
ncbi:MAG: cytochrome d ubiquinol oxidase subunit II [Bryobacteraceae bacterium]